MQKHNPQIILIALFSILSISTFASAQDSIRITVMKEKLDFIAQTNALYNEKLDISVNEIQISELLKNIAKASDLNINIETDGGKRMTCNFKQITIIDILFFICKEYSFDVEIVGNVLSIYPYIPIQVEPEIQMSYHPEGKTISFDFTEAKLVKVVKKIAESTGINVIIPQPLFEYQVSGYGTSMRIDDAIQSIAAMNGLDSQKKDETIWSIYQEDTDHKSGAVRQNLFRNDELTVDSLGLITAKIAHARIQDLLLDICYQLNINHFFVNQLEQSTGIHIESADIDSFLKTLFTGTNYTWRVDSGIYIFGEMNDKSSLSAVRVFAMRYRTVDKVIDVIPAELKRGIEILTFPDLNSLIISGGQQNIMQLIAFLNDIDKSVPLISIDVIILDVTNTTSREAGISMGLGTEPTTTSGSLSPGINFSLGANSVNKLINSFNGFGSINLGKVNSNFYMGLKLLEEDGKVFLRSTPRLSTLNGNKAILKSGEMRYYKESQINIIGTQNPLQSESYQWKPIEANLVLDITPFVSLDSCITMKIELTQSEFTEREAEEAPPGTTTRSFNSIIKVRDQEMVLLGGIERNFSSRTSKGLPFIARIPILRWIFGTSYKKKSVQKLNVFIKPTIIE